MTVVETILEQNLDCLVVCGGDFNVDFERDWVHTRLLTDFCDHNSLYNSNNNTHDNVYSAVIMTTGHCESSLGSFDECRPAPISSRRPSDQAT